VPPEILDPLDIYDRGLANLASLEGVERYVFFLMDFDNLMEMEGWDHFFLHEHHFAWYAEMKEWLRKAEDQAALTVLADFEGWLHEHGLGLPPDEDEYWTVEEAARDSVPDWCQQYCDLREARWARAIAYFERCGAKLA
jgi:hypothetical protein